MTKRYVHTLLFSCPHCKLPVVVSHIREEGNIEAIEGSLTLRCSQCGQSSDVLAATAKRHWVDDWPHQELP
jgi:transcription elongation factor Elf1